MKLLLLATIVAVALARIPSQTWEREHFLEEYELAEESFRPEREYIFKYNGQVATGLPGSSRQHALSQVQAKVSLVFRPNNKVIMTIRQVRIGKLNEEIPNPRAMIPFMSFQPVELTSEQEKQILLPVLFEYTQGVVSEFEFDGQEKPWSANIKRGIINMLQVNLAKRNQINLSDEVLINKDNLEQSTINPKFDFFSTNEKTVEGECKTHYTVVSNPSTMERRQVLNVTRSVDYEDCKQRPEMKYNFRFQDPCTRCGEELKKDDEKFLKSSSVAKFNISGTPQDFVIESAIVESQYQVIPFNKEGNMVSTYINQTLVLKYSGKVLNENQIRRPRQPVQSDSDLVYTLDWDLQKEEYFMKGEKKQNPIQHENPAEYLRELIRPMVSEMRDCVQEDVPQMYLRLVNFFEFVEKKQLKTLFEQFVHEQPESFSTEEHFKIKSILIDALADAGTKDTISYLLELIKEEKMTPLRASIVLKQLINVRIPSKEIIQEFVRFIQLPIVQRNWILKQSAYLTLGSLVQGVCMPSEDKLALLPRGSNVLPARRQPNQRLCPDELQEKILQNLFSELEEKRENYEDQILILKTIGNMGLPQSIVQLEKIIKNVETEYNLLVRAEAIQALRQLRELIPNKVVRILMPIFMSVHQPNHLRMAAIYQIFQTMPSRPILDQVSRKLFSERSQQVASFVYSYMYTVANTTHPCEKTFARDLQLSLRHGRKIAGAFLPQYSKYLHQTYYSEKYLTGVDMSLVSIINNRTFVPTTMAMNVHSRFLGFWSKYLMSAGFVQQNVESLLSQYLRRTEFSDISLEDVLARSPRAQGSPLKELKKLWKQLETVAREMPSFTPKGYMFLKLKDQEFFMLPITKKTMKQLPSLSEIKRTFVQGKHFNIHKAAILHSFQYKIPTAIGMPLRVAVWVPTMTQLSGQVRVETENPFKIMLNNIKPSVAASVISRVEIWSPFTTTGVQIKATAKVCTPVTGKVVLDIKSRMPSLKFSVEPPKKPVEWLKLETIPSTYTRENIQSIRTYPYAQHKTIMGEQWNRIRNVRDLPVVRRFEQLVRQVFGVEMRMEGLWHHTKMSSPMYIPVCPFSGPNHLSIRSRPTQEQPKEFVMKLSVQNIQEYAQKIRAEPFEMEYEEEPRFENTERKGYQTVFKTELYTKGAESQERRAELETELTCTPFLRVCKVNTKVIVQPIPQLIRRPFKLCLKGQSQLPIPSFRFNELFNKQVSGFLKTTWGFEECSEENVVEFKLNAKHSQQQREFYQQEPEYQWFSEERCQNEPSMCSEVEMEQRLRQKQQLLKYNMVIRYQNLPIVVKNMTNKVFQSLKSYYYWNVDTMNFALRNPENLVRAELTLDTRTRQFFNMTIKTPVENVTVTDALLPVPVFYPLHIRQPYAIRNFGDLLENILRPVVQQCRVSERRIQTFDEVKYRTPLSTCWSLLSKDCEDESNPSYAVLIKKLRENQEEKQIKIVTYKHKIILTPENEQIIVKINGKTIPEQEYTYNQHLQVEQYSRRQILVTLPKVGIKVYFDGFSARVEMSPMMNSIQCGLCGHYDDEQSNEYRTANNELVSDVRRFFQSYTVKDSKCQYPEQLNEISESQELRYEPEWQQENEWENNEESSSEEEWSPVQRLNTVLRHVSVEQGSKICFSTKAIPRCPTKAFPSEYEPAEMKLSLRCIRRSHPEARRLLNFVRYESEFPSEMLEILKESPESSFEQEYQIPTTCRRHFF